MTCGFSLCFGYVLVVIFGRHAFFGLEDFAANL